MFKLGTARDFASVMLMYEEREGKRETDARKVCVCVCVGGGGVRRE